MNFPIFSFFFFVFSFFLGGGLFSGMSAFYFSLFCLLFVILLVFLFVFVFFLVFLCFSHFSLFSSFRQNVVFSAHFLEVGVTRASVFRASGRLQETGRFAPTPPAYTNPIRNFPVLGVPQENSRKFAGKILRYFAICFKIQESGFWGAGRKTCREPWDLVTTFCAGSLLKLTVTAFSNFSDCCCCSSFPPSYASS